MQRCCTWPPRVWLAMAVTSASTDGLTLARIMKADLALARLPLVMLTSVAQRGHKTLAREAGISACLTKPVRQSQLFDCVATVLGASVAPEVPRIPPVTRKQKGR